jgi:hypothetical protein
LIEDSLLMLSVANINSQQLYVFLMNNKAFPPSISTSNKCNYLFPSSESSLAGEQTVPQSQHEPCTSDIQVRNIITYADMYNTLLALDPNDWSVAHVRLWLLWAVRQFNLVGLSLSDWNITGKQLCQLSLADFHSMVPVDPGDLFWTHLELLRKCKFIGELF